MVEVFPELSRVVTDDTATAFRSSVLNRSSSLCGKCLEKLDHAVAQRTRHGRVGGHASASLACQVTRFCKQRVHVAYVASSGMHPRTRVPPWNTLYG